MPKQHLYPEAPSSPDFPQLEESVLAFWKKNDVFRRSVEQRAAREESGNNNEFVFYDGPPFANGLPHYGHLLTGFVKDIFARYQTMKGKRVERRFGWDCHGLPAEMGAEKELNISGRHAIMEYGIGKFNDHCRSSVMKFAGQWENYVNRQARWVDFSNDYKTMNRDYMESVLWAFKQLYDKGLVYESMRVMPYSWACETPLSNFETRMDNAYREKQSKAVTVAFELDEVPEFVKAQFPNVKTCKLLAWTTTPWTLPSNLALGVGGALEYMAVVREEEPSPSGRGQGEGIHKTEYARELRKDSTEVEKKLWSALRNRSLESYKFRRQETIGKYIADFVCWDKRLIVELDGGQHAEQQPYDAERTKFFEGKGFRVLRFWNNEVNENLEGVAEKILEVLNDPHPLPEGEGMATCYILAKNSLASYQKELGIKGEGEFYSLQGSDLVGLTYKPLFPYFADKKAEGAFKVLAADFVVEGDGTGIVHLAPGFGEDDFAACQQAGIPLVCPVDNAGKFTAEIFDLACGSPLEGEHASQAQGAQASGGGYTQAALKNAQELRKELTPEEKKLWFAFKEKLPEYKFRRQQPMGSYIVDFFCSEKRLVIELDGGQHAEQQPYDAERTKFLEAQGYRVLRFWNNEVNENLEGVLERIAQALNAPHDSASASGLASSAPPQGGSLLLSLQGKQVFETNDDIIKYLKATGAWLKTEQYTHNYPHCWRTDTPLIYKAVPSWYVEVTKFKDRMVELNQSINWIPGHIRDGLFGKWLENARDWSISRNRFWGTPIPVWRSDNPKNKKLYVFGSINELEVFFKVKVEDLHRPFIDELTAPDPEDGNYTLRRVEDVFDCWFESGSMPYAQVHYPFENKDWFENHFPADFIVEYVAQTRGWFYTLMVLSTALFDRPPFKNVICHGVVLDEKGQKLSKRLNNYADPADIFDKFGSDAMRWVMVGAPIMQGGELLIDKEGNMIRDAVRLILKPIWNAYHFFTLYANADDVKAEYRLTSDNAMDRYILAKCKHAVTALEKALDGYDTPAACREVERFFEILNNWYIRRSRLRFWKEERDEDKQAAYDTLYSVLQVMMRAVSPLLPLLSEAVYRGLMRAGEEDADISVHLAEFPDVSSVLDEAALMHDMDRVRDVCNAALSIRNAENIRVRQPLSRLVVVMEHAGNLDPYVDIIRDEVNVKEVAFSDDVTKHADYKLQLHFPVLGKRLPAKMKQIIAESKQGKWKQIPGSTIEICGEKLEKEEYDLQLLPKEAKGAQALSSNDALVLLDLIVTNELRLEGVARDLVRMVQQSRKEANLNIADRIHLYVESNSSSINDALVDFREYIAEQTLAVEVQAGAVEKMAHRFTQELEGEGVVIGLNKAA